MIFCKLLLKFFSLQNALFYILSDDAQWVQENLVNIDEHIYYVGVKEYSTNDGQVLSNEDQVG